MSDERRDMQVGGAYPFAQLAKAFVTARGHADEAVRQGAVKRIDQWTSVLRGMATGRLRIGSRAPVEDLPIWVTPEVVRGGFATGAAAAGTKLEPWETSIAARAGVEKTHAAVFAYLLTEPGLEELNGLLESGAYEIRLPEQAALLTVAWLVRSGETAAAVSLTEELAPFADRILFVPEPSDAGRSSPSIICRQTVGETGAALARRGPNDRVEAMREALAVWNPFADEVLSLWLETMVDGAIASTRPPGWKERASALLDHYTRLAEEHRRSSKHRRPKENLAILLAALRDAVDGEPHPRRRGLLQHAVDSMVAKRDRPESPRHAELRAAQRYNAEIPAHHTLARVVVRRLGSLVQSAGVSSTEALTAPVTAAEATEHGVPEDSEIPPSIQRVVRRALAGEPELLIERGVIPSAEVLAELVPPIAASTVALAYGDECLAALMAANYEAFRRRRTLLLLNLEHQVRVEELPWVRAVAHHRRRSEDTGAAALAALARLTELAIEAFPATIMPSPLVSELDILSREAGVDLPLVEELAADIFMGTFSAKFLRAAKLAGDLLEGSLYARYYAIDYAAIRAIDDVPPARHRAATRTSPAFDALCASRAGFQGDGFSVAANGTVIEQAQILTTHNLAALIGPAGVGPTVSLDYPALASRCFDRALALAGQLQNNPRPLGTVKNLAYAWRQMLFFLAVSDATAFTATARERLEDSPPPHQRLAPALEGLTTIIDGGSFDPNGKAGPGRRLLGWSVGEHWLLSSRG